MSVEISFGGVCRDLNKLPGSEADLKSFFMDKLVPAMWTDFSQNVAMTKGNANGQRDAIIGLGERGCEIGGSVTIKF
jgi:hypothetical protein